LLVHSARIELGRSWETGSAQVVVVLLALRRVTHGGCIGCGLSQTSHPENGADGIG
jgi:hypothetical protein